MAKKAQKNSLHRSFEVTPYVCLQISCDDAFLSIYLTSGMLNLADEMSFVDREKSSWLQR